MRERVTADVVAPYAQAIARTAPSIPAWWKDPEARIYLDKLARLFRKSLTSNGT
jgi:hypothetical protein